MSAATYTCKKNRNKNRCKYLHGGYMKCSRHGQMLVFMYGQHGTTDDFVLDHFCGRSFIFLRPRTPFKAHEYFFKPTWRTLGNHARVARSCKHSNEKPLRSLTRRKGQSGKPSCSSPPKTRVVLTFLRNQPHSSQLVNIFLGSSLCSSFSAWSPRC